MTTTLDKKIDKISASLKKREDEKEYQFPLWSEGKRGVPNDIVRSALFTSRRTVGKDYLRDMVVFSQSDLEITYSGQRLNQDHLDVFEGIMHLARNSNAESTVEFQLHQMLKLIGRNTGGKDRIRLQSALSDLTATNVRIKHTSGRSFWGSLLPGGSYDNNTKVFKLTINRDLIKLFDAGFTTVRQEQRLALGRSTLAKYLQGWISSHGSPYPVSVSYLKDISGSEAKELKHFRANLRKSLDLLKTVGFLDSWDIDGEDKVHIIKLS